MEDLSSHESQYALVMGFSANRQGQYISNLEAMNDFTKEDAEGVQWHEPSDGFFLCFWLKFGHIHASSTHLIIPSTNLCK
jgi:hypothetical protein